MNKGDYLGEPRLPEQPTLRDFFAAHAPPMEDWYTQHVRPTLSDPFEAEASFRYDYADAMLKQRSK